MVLTVYGMDGQTVGLDRGQMRTAGDDGHRGPGAVQADGEVAADRAGAVDADFHGAILLGWPYRTPGPSGAVKAPCSGRAAAILA